MGKNTSGLRPWEPGQSGNPRGRPKGSRDWALRLRDEALEALKRCGGVDYLVEQARKRPRAFLQFLARFLPRDTQLGSDEDKPVSIIVQKLYEDAQGNKDGQ